MRAGRICNLPLGSKRDDKAYIPLSIKVRYTICKPLCRLADARWQNAEWSQSLRGQRVDKRLLPTIASGGTFIYHLLASRPVLLGWLEIQLHSAFQLRFSCLQQLCPSQQHRHVGIMPACMTCSGHFAPAPSILVESGDSRLDDSEFSRHSVHHENVSKSFCGFGVDWKPNLTYAT